MSDDKDFWDVGYLISGELFDTNLSYGQIADKFGMSLEKVVDIVEQLGLSWTRDQKRNMSKGASLLTSLFKELIPGERIINEFHVGERLMLDVYCPQYKLGAEYHGIQHFQYNNMFHEFISDFIAGQNRDQRKLELCREQGITVIAFRYDEKLTEDIVSKRIIDGLTADTKSVRDIIPSKKEFSEYEKSLKERRRKMYREQYKKVKEFRNRDNNR